MKYQALCYLRKESKNRYFRMLSSPALDGASRLNITNVGNGSFYFLDGLYPVRLVINWSLKGLQNRIYFFHILVKLDN